MKLKGKNLTEWLAKRIAGTGLRIGYFGTFLFCGFWHGSGFHFIAWGLYHAVGLLVFDAMRISRGPIPPTPPTSTRADVVPLVFGVAGTFLFVSLGWVLFVLPLSTVARIHL